MIKSLEPSIKVLEDRAKHASLKENFFEIFKPAKDDEIKDFLAIVKNVDPKFDVDKFLDKKKPYHYSPADVCAKPLLDKGTPSDELS